jgi:very-short-patch-repair endonuclease
MDEPIEPRALRTLRTQRVAKALALAAEQGGVIGLAQLRGLGITRAQTRAQVAARRWQRIHSQVVAIHTGPLSDVGTMWAAVLEGGPQAYLDGASALIAEGLTGFTWDTIRVSVPPTARVRRAPGLLIRRTRRHDQDIVARQGVPRARPQAALLLTMSVQQRLTTPERIGQALLGIRRDRRRAFLHATVLDLLDGVRSMSEAEFAAECRRRGLPPPSRQVVRKGKDGRYYLDVYWEEWGVVVEIDGIQHTWASNVVGDALRQNRITLDSDVVLRLPLLGLCVAADDFFDQIIEALRSAGCPLVDDQVV